MPMLSDNRRLSLQLVSQLRASFVMLLARLGVARIPLPGGCTIERPVDLIRGLQAMGADVKIEHGMVHAYVAGRNGS